MDRPPIEEGSKAFAAVEAELGAVDREDLLTVRFDLKKAAGLCLGLSEKIAKDGLEPDFLALPQRFFDREAISRLALYARAAVYAEAESAAVETREADARISVSLLDRAREIKRRMLRVVDYYLGDDALAGPEIASIKEGSGYQDLASDLLRLSRLYRTHQQFLCEDSRHFRPEDERGALELSDDIVEALRESQSVETARWQDRRRRIAVLLGRDYKELRSAAIWIYRSDPSKLAHFPEFEEPRHKH